MHRTPDPALSSARRRVGGLVTAAIVALIGAAAVAWWLDSRPAPRGGDLLDARTDTESPARRRVLERPAPASSAGLRPSDASKRRQPPAKIPDDPLAGGLGTGGEQAGGTAGGGLELEAELLPAQRRLLDRPWQEVIDAMNQEMTMLVSLCLEHAEPPLPPVEGLALDFVMEPKHGEAKITEVRIREESKSRPEGLTDCVQGLAGIGPVPMEIADRLDDGVFTLRLGENVDTAPQ